MEKNDDLFITDQAFINFLLHDNSGNMTNVSWNASSMTNLSHTCLNSLSNVHNDIKTYSNESMVILLNNLYQIKMEEQQIYKGPLGINSLLLESIQANKLLKFMQSKSNPKSFFLHYKIIEEFLFYCSIQLNKPPSNINDLDLYNEKLFLKFAAEKKITTKEHFKRIYTLYFQNGDYLNALDKGKQIEEFKHPLIERHLEELKRKCTNSSFLRRKLHYRKFFNWLTTVFNEFQNYSINTVPLYLVTKNQLEEYKVVLMNQFKKGIYKKHTISDAFYNIRSLFASLYQMGIIPNDISINVIGIKFEKYKYRDIPTNLELSKFFNAVMCYAPDPLKFCTAYRLMLYLGLRQSEVANLEATNINFGTNTISVKGKGGKYDILPLPKLLVDDLYSLVNLNENYVFSNKPNIFKNELYTYYKLISFILNWDYPGGVHIFRHTFITRLSELPNLPPQVIQYLSRHSRPDTTSLYIHRNEKFLDNAINKIDYF
ncbi:tyrosine-type recombinase/integrase [Psychrobacillus sp. FSL K6-1415]|uniref:tyrosine-type recombinase/integrase n=1 Tax=Psychrobacillus sp. FSL K6-1415 TaxID=2921544 RepID=UPI0030FA5C19